MNSSGELRARALLSTALLALPRCPFSPRPNETGKQDRQFGEVNSFALKTIDSGAEDQELSVMSISQYANRHDYFYLLGTTFAQG